jgi:hypothetical protein
MRQALEGTYAQTFVNSTSSHPAKFKTAQLIKRSMFPQVRHHKGRKQTAPTTMLWCEAAMLLSVELCCGCGGHLLLHQEQ